MHKGCLVAVVEAVEQLWEPAVTANNVLRLGIDGAERSRVSSEK